MAAGEILAALSAAHGHGGVATGGAVPGCVLPGCGLVDLLPSIGGSLARSLAVGVLGAFTASLRSAATWVVGHVMTLVSPGTRVRLGPTSWFAGTFPEILPIAALVVVPLALVATIGAVVRQDLRRLGRIWLVGVPVGAGAGGAVRALAQVGVTAVDELCGLLHPTAAVVRITWSAGRDLLAAPEVVQALVALVVLFGGVCLWLELVLRAASVYLALFFMPLAMATLVWPAVAGAARRFLEVLAALVLAKLVIVGALTVGAGALGAERGGVDAAITGAAVLLMAAFAPFAVLRLVPVVELSAIAHLEGLARRPARAVESAPGRVAPQASRAGALLDQLHRPEDGGLETSPAPRLALPERPTDWTLPPDPYEGGSAGQPGGASSANGAGGSGGEASPGSRAGSW